MQFTVRLNKKMLLIPVAIAGLVLTTAGSCDGNNAPSTTKDQNATNTQLQQYQGPAQQGIPFYQWSQYRQTLLDVENAQVNGIATTTFFFNQGIQKPVKVCPSIGFPMPSTAQLSNPQQLVTQGSGGSYVGGTIAQLEPNGVYTGDSSGTYVVCVAPNGTKYISYWEGFVHAEGGPAHWDNTTNQIVLDGSPTVVTKTK